MVLQEIFSEKSIILNLESESKDELFEELVQKLVDVNPEINRQKALDAVLTREKSMTTGIVNKVAVPHGVLEGLTKSYGVIGISKKGIEYGSLDGEDVHYVFMFLFSADDNEVHLKALRDLSSVLQNPEFTKNMHDVSSPKEVLKLLGCL